LAVLRAREENDWGKVEIARRVRKETTVSLNWIAEHLQSRSVADLPKLIKKE